VTKTQFTTGCTSTSCITNNRSGFVLSTEIGGITCLHTYKCVYICIYYVYVYTMNISIYIYTSIFVYIYIYIFMYLYRYMYTMLSSRNWQKRSSISTHTESPCITTWEARAPARSSLSQASVLAGALGLRQASVRLHAGTRTCRSMVHLTGLTLNPTQSAHFESG